MENVIRELELRENKNYITKNILIQIKNQHGHSEPGIRSTETIQANTRRAKTDGNYRKHHETYEMIKRSNIYIIGIT